MAKQVSERQQLIDEGLAAGMSKSAATAHADDILATRDVVRIDKNGKRTRAETGQEL